MPVDTEKVHVHYSESRCSCCIPIQIKLLGNRFTDTSRAFVALDREDLQFCGVSGTYSILFLFN